MVSTGTEDEEDQEKKEELRGEAKQHLNTALECADWHGLDEAVYLLVSVCGETCGTQKKGKSMLTEDDFCACDSCTSKTTR